jgi:hypothetical protein
MGNDARAPLVIDQWARLSPAVIALQEVSLLTDQGTWLCREVNERRGDAEHYRIKHAAHPDKAPAAAGLGVASLRDPLSHEILDLMSFESIAQRLVFEVDGSGSLADAPALPGRCGTGSRPPDRILARLARQAIGRLAAHPHW